MNAIIRVRRREFEAEGRAANPNFRERPVNGQDPDVLYLIRKWVL